MRWPACSSRPSTHRDPVPRRVILATELVQRASSAGRRCALKPAGDRRTLQLGGSASSPPIKVTDPEE